MTNELTILTYFTYFLRALCVAGPDMLGIPALKNETSKASIYYRRKSIEAAVRLHKLIDD